MCTHMHVPWHVCIGEMSSVEVGSLLLPCGSQRWSSGCLAWPRMSFSYESSHQSRHSPIVRLFIWLFHPCYSVFSHAFHSFSSGTKHVLKLCFSKYLLERVLETLWWGLFSCDPWPCLCMFTCRLMWQHSKAFSWLYTVWCLDLSLCSTS